ncbi:hypothetical protein [Endozoicomonas sp. SESOKO3]|uniref:hypothetical protein n=1 Tax=Endozoicomonas sp. SESOKO3 TaxID=2828744 RepID=UPI002147F39D|nr:hypothetical protein [Endozoicomonas sp. SESOKO3]
MSLSVISMAEPLKEGCIVEHKQKAVFPNLGFSIKCVLRALSCTLSFIVDRNGCTGTDFLLNDKRHRPVGYELKTIIIESILWHWLYTTPLLVVCELILTTKDASIRFTSRSCLPLEAIFAVGWFLKSYWDLGSPLFSPIEQQASQGHSFAIISMVPGSGDNSQQYPPSESSGQQVPAVASAPVGFFTRLLYSESGDNNRNPHQNSHTLGLNCFAHPCYGVCQFRSSEATPGQSAGLAYNTGPTRRTCSDVPLPGNLPVTPDDLIIISGLLSLSSQGLPEENRISFAFTRFTHSMKTLPSGCLASGGGAHCQQALLNHKRKDHTGQRICDLALVDEDGQQKPCGEVCKNTKALAYHKRRLHSGHKTCDVTVIDEDEQPRPCAKVCKNALVLSVHKSKDHSGPKTCDVIVVGEDGQQQPCGVVCECAKILVDHKRVAHSGQQTCDVIVMGEGGQQWACGKVCKNARDLSVHKSRYHTGKKICDETWVGGDGQPRPCGKLCENARRLTNHKRREHSGPKNCDIKVVGEDDQLRPCGAVCKNVQALSCHKSKVHTGQKICDVTVVEEDGKPRLCGRVCRHAQALSDHKRSAHGERKTCDVSVVGEDGQQRLCGLVCKNSRSLTKHKRKHLKRKLVDSAQNDDLGPGSDTHPLIR